MVVLGSEAFIFESTSRTCNVMPFDPNLGVSNNIPIVDGAIAYECPYTGESVVLILRNALHMPHLKHNIIAPFIMRTAGVSIDDKPKIHCDDPSVDNHCIKFNDSDLRIPLKLHGIFSYFKSRKPTIKELHELPKLFLTPDADDWNPHTSTFSSNEDSMLDFNGEMADKSRRKNDLYVFEEDENDNPMLASVSVDIWESHIDANISSAYVAPSVKPQINNPDVEFANALNVRGEVSKVASAIGNCDFSKSGSDNSLFGDTPYTTSWDNFEESLKGALDDTQIAFVQAQIAAAEASKPTGISPQVLSKLWCISEKLAEGAVDQNT